MIKLFYCHSDLDFGTHSIRRHSNVLNCLIRPIFQLRWVHKKAMESHPCHVNPPSLWCQTFLVVYGTFRAFHSRICKFQAYNIQGLYWNTRAVTIPTLTAVTLTTKLASWQMYNGFNYILYFGMTPMVFLIFYSSHARAIHAFLAEHPAVSFVWVRCAHHAFSSARERSGPQTLSILTAHTSCWLYFICAAPGCLK